MVWALPWAPKRTQPPGTLLLWHQWAFIKRSFSPILAKTLTLYEKEKCVLTLDIRTPGPYVDAPVWCLGLCLVHLCKACEWPPTHSLTDIVGRLISYLFSSEQCPYNPLLLEPEQSQLALLEGAAVISKGGSFALLTHVFWPWGKKRHRFKKMPLGIAGFLFISFHHYNM